MSNSAASHSEDQKKRPMSPACAVSASHDHVQTPLLTIPGDPPGRHPKRLRAEHTTEERTTEVGTHRCPQCCAFVHPCRLRTITKRLPRVITHGTESHWSPILGQVTVRHTRTSDNEDHYRKLQRRVLDLEREISDKMKGQASADLLEPVSLSAFFKEIETTARKERTYEMHCWFNAPCHVVRWVNVRGTASWVQTHSLVFF